MTAAPNLKSCELPSPSAEGDGSFGMCVQSGRRLERFHRANTLKKGSRKMTRNAGKYVATADRISEPWGARTPYGQGETWPTRVDQYLAEGVTEEDVDAWVQSAAILHLHSNGDGLDIAVKDGRIVGVRGRAEDCINHGRVNPRDLFGWQANRSPDRLTRPLVRRGGRLELGRSDGPYRGTFPTVLGRQGSPQFRLLHFRTALFRGVLHPRGDRSRVPVSFAGEDG